MLLALVAAGAAWMPAGLPEAALGKRRAPDEPEVKEEPAQRPRTEAAPLAPVPSAYAIEEMD